MIGASTFGYGFRFHSGCEDRRGQRFPFPTKSGSTFRCKILVSLQRGTSMEFPKRELETLWCPWRVEYFQNEKPNADFLSEAARASDDAAHLVIARRKTAFLMMNRYPYAVGHLMAVPYRKTGVLADF